MYKNILFLKKRSKVYYFFPSQLTRFELAVGSRSHPIFIFRNGRDDHFKPWRYTEKSKDCVL